jgi:hypothetical protein
MNVLNKGCECNMQNVLDLFTTGYTYNRLCHGLCKLVINLGNIYYMHLNVHVYISIGVLL